MGVPSGKSTTSQFIDITGYINYQHEYYYTNTAHTGFTEVQAES